ncbi:hypothetical protein P7C70_g693, partial [Phenoliferia sp. Uapishka_3]
MQIRFLDGKADATELIPAEQLQALFGGEVDFQYVRLLLPNLSSYSPRAHLNNSPQQNHETYFPAIVKLCSERKTANQARWAQYGDNKCGLSEAIIRGAILPDGTKVEDKQTGGEKMVKDASTGLEFVDAPTATEGELEKAVETTKEDGAAADLDKPRKPFVTIHTALEESTAHGTLSPAVSKATRERLSSLTTPHDPFPRTPPSKSVLKSGNVQAVSGLKGKLSEAGLKVVEEVAERFELDDGESLMAVRALEKGRVERLEQDDWDCITAGVFEERMAVLGIVTLLLRASDDPSHPCNELANELAPSIFTPTLPSTLLDSFIRRTQQSLPNIVRSNPHHALFWAKQLIREQRAILELVFLLFYVQPPKASDTIALFTAIADTAWGQQQESVGYFDEETKGLVSEIGDLLAIMAVESLSLEEALESKYLIPATNEPPLPQTSPFHPTQLKILIISIEKLVNTENSSRSSPVLLGMAFLLSRVTESLREQGCPDSYLSLATSTLRIESTQPLFQAYAAHALQPSSSLFPTLHSAISSPLFGSTHASTSDPNAFGYAAVLRTLFACVPNLFRLTYLSATQYAGFVDTFAALYSSPAGSALAANFWQAAIGMDGGEKMDQASFGESTIVDLAQSRFPVQFGPFVKIARGLADVAAANSSREDEQEEEENGGGDKARAETAAQMTTEYLSRLPSLTAIVHLAPGLPPPYEEHGYVGEIPRFRSTRPIAISKNIVIPIGTTGTLVSERSRKPVVVSWELTWSAWKLFGDILENYAMPDSSSTSVDVFGGESGNVGPTIPWGSDEERVEDITNIVDIFRTAITNKLSLAQTLVDHLAEGQPESYHFIRVVFVLLEKSLAAQDKTPAKLVEALLGLVSNLLTTTSGAIWAYLRGSTVLFPISSITRQGSSDPSRNAILHAEKLAGSYPVTLALLALVNRLVLEEQTSSSAIRDPAYVLMKRGVLVRALSWVRDEVWASYGSWKFNELEQKYEMSKRMVQLYHTVLEAAELSPEAPKGDFEPVAKVVVDALLARATSSQLAPILSILSMGPEPILLLRKALRYANAQALESLVEATLALTLQLIRLRRRIVGTTSSLLESLLLSHEESVGANGVATRDTVAALAGFVTTSVSANAATAASRTLALLCISSSEWQPRPPGFIRLLGGSAKAEKFVVAILRLVEEDEKKHDLQVAIWDLISAIVETQPSLAVLLITGRHYLFGLDDGKPVESAGKDSAVILGKSLLKPAASPPLERTAVGVALEAVGTWADNWRDRPATLAATLRFLDYTWQHLVDFGPALEQIRGNSGLWEKLIAIAFASAEDHDEPQALYCHRMMAKASAIRIIALDLQAALLKPRAEDVLSAKSLLKAFEAKTKKSNPLKAAVSLALKSDWAPEFHQKLLAQIHDAYENINMEALRVPRSTHPLDDADARAFGGGYYYSLTMLGRKVDGFNAIKRQGMDDSDGDIELEDGESESGKISEIDAAIALNVNYSVLEAQVSNTRAWRQLLEIALPLIRRYGPAASNLASAAVLTASTIAEETRDGQIMTAVHQERLSILQTMLEVLHEVESAKKPLTEVLTQISLIFTNEALPALDSVVRDVTPAFHRTLFSAAYIAFHKLNSYGYGETPGVDFGPEFAVPLGHSTDSILRVMITAVRDLLLLAKAKQDPEVEQDLMLAISVVALVIRSPFAPPAKKWISYCRNVDLFRTAFDVFVHMEEVDGRPLYALHVLNLCLSMASSSALAAEAMALEGLMASLCNNALSSEAEVGAIRVTSHSGERTHQHEVWTSMLALVVALSSALGQDTSFVEQEVTGFIMLYNVQISRALSWTIKTPLTLPALEEIQNTASLVFSVVRVRGSKSPLLEKLVEQTLLLLQQVNDALMYPVKLAGLLTPISLEERGPFERDLVATDVEEKDRASLAERPVMGRVTLAFVHIAQVLVSALTTYTEAFRTLSRDEVEWRPDLAIIIPSDQVANGAVAANIGTLFDLASFCVDLLQPAPPRAAALTKVPPPNPPLSTPLLRYDQKLITANAKQTLEEVLLLVATQLALWVYRSDPDQRRQITRNLVVDLSGWLDKAPLDPKFKAALRGFVARRLDSELEDESEE